MRSATLKLLCLAAMAAVAKAEHEAESDVGDCGGLRDEPEGSVDYHRDTIAAGTFCWWRIEVPGATKITLTFNDVFLSSSGRACKQLLMVTEGNGYERRLVTSRSTGNFAICNKRSGSPPGPIEVTGETVSLQLAATFASIGTGFSLSYKAEMPAACPQPTGTFLGGAVCDDVTEGGPWTVVQRRTVGDLLFNKTFEEYREGFGTLEGDYWVGLDALHELCGLGCKLRIELEMEVPSWSSWYRADGRYVAVYEYITIGSQAGDYTLLVSLYDKDSTAPDSLTAHSGSSFSTYDRDLDTNTDGNCAVDNGGNGGWWYYHCRSSNLNGQWGADGGRGLAWMGFMTDISATASRMLVGPDDL